MVYHNPPAQPAQSVPVRRAAVLLLCVAAATAAIGVLVSGSDFLQHSTIAKVQLDTTVKKCQSCMGVMDASNKPAYASVSTMAAQLRDAQRAQATGKTPPDPATLQYLAAQLEDARRAQTGLPPLNSGLQPPPALSPATPLSKMSVSALAAQQRDQARLEMIEGKKFKAAAAEKARQQQALDAAKSASVRAAAERDAKRNQTLMEKGSKDPARSKIEGQLAHFQASLNSAVSLKRHGSRMYDPKKEAGWQFQVNALNLQLEAMDNATRAKSLEAAPPEPVAVAAESTLPAAVNAGNSTEDGERDAGYWAKKSEQTKKEPGAAAEDEHGQRDSNYWAKKSEEEKQEAGTADGELSSGSDDQAESGVNAHEDDGNAKEPKHKKHKHKHKHKKHNK